MCINCTTCKTNKKNCFTAKLTNVLVLVGSLNWGLVGIGMLLNAGINFNLVNIIFGFSPVLEAIVYLVVGISALVLIFGCKCKTCKEGSCCKDCK